MSEGDAGGATGAPAAGRGSATRRTHEEIHEEHRLLGEMLRDLEGSRDLFGLPGKLGELRRRLVDHFETEEAADGLYAVVERSGSHLLGRVQQVVDEHARFLATIDQLSASVKACLDGPVQEIRGGIEGLVAALRDHEARETELLSDALYTDLGGGA